MFFRALLAFLVLPGIAGIIVPPLIAQFDPWRGTPVWQGSLLMLAGLVLLLWCVHDFYVRGKGTLAPWDPPRKLVVAGPYRYMRNPMYVGVLTLVAGWALSLVSMLVTLYVIVLAIAFHIRVVVHEEPWLASQFGDEWVQYCVSVPRWFPQFKLWSGRS